MIRASLDPARCHALVRQVLEHVAETVAHESRFQRVVATFYDSALIPGSPEPTSGVLTHACRGLSDADRVVVSRLLEERPEVDGTRYPKDCRIGNCYYYCASSGHHHPNPAIPSRRTYLAHDGWTHRDALLAPFWDDGQILGQISVDDPRDGGKPDRHTLDLLEEIAAMAAVALRDIGPMQELSEMHRLFESLTESGMAGVIVIRGERIDYSNRQTEALLGYDGSSLTELVPWWSFLHPDDRPFAWSCVEHPDPEVRTIRAVRRDGRIVWFRARAYPTRYRDEAAVAIQFFDVTEQVEAETQLRERALRDPLTGLRNRAYFDETIHLEVVRCRRYKRPFTLMIADLRNFKLLNDSFGHQEGDRILAGVAALMEDELRESDWIVRYGGDEFLLVLPETGQEVDSLIERLQKRIIVWAEENVQHGVPFGVDFGWSTWRPDAPVSVQQLLKAADDRLYVAKRSRCIEPINGGEEADPGAPAET